MYKEYHTAAFFAMETYSSPVNIKFNRELSSFLIRQDLYLNKYGIIKNFRAVISRKFLVL